MKNKHQNHVAKKESHLCKMCNAVCKPFKNFFNKIAGKFGKMKQGFTLIELLIVIAIIGILAVSLLPSVLGAPARARDAARKADVTNIIAAVESFSAANGRYPDTSGCIDSELDPNTGGDLGLLNTFFKGGQAPVPPSGEIAGCESQYLYCRLPGPNQYYIAAQMETAGSTKGYRAAEPSIADCDDAAEAEDANGVYFINVQ